MAIFTEDLKEFVEITIFDQHNLNY